MFLALVNASVPVKDAQRFADYYKGAYVGCWEPYSDDAGEPIFTAELITGAMMLCFFFVEVMDEEAEMFLQALLVFSGPQNYAPPFAAEVRFHIIRQLQTMHA